MDKMRQWTMLTVVGVVAVLGAGWFLAVSPQRHHAGQLRSQAANQQSANSQLQARVSQLQQQQKGLPAQQRRLNQIATKIPDNPALPALIRQLSAAADGAGVDLVSLSPANPTTFSPVGSAAPTTATTTAATGTTGALAQIPVAITVQGSYYNVESFFDAIEKLPRAVLVPGWSMNVVTGSGTTGSAASGSGSGAATQQLPDGTIQGQINAVVFESPQVASAPTTPVAPAAPAN